MRESLSNKETAKPSRLRRAIARVASRESKVEKAEEPYEVAIETYEAGVVAREALVEQGYETFTGAIGPWVDGKDARIVHEVAYYHPDGKVVRFSTYKTFTDSGHTIRSFPHQSRELTVAEYDEHVAEWQLRVGEEKPIKEVPITPKSPEL